MEQNISSQTWEARVSTKLEKATAHQIWPLFQDFFGLHQWFPGLAICHGIHGTNGEPGCVRYCAGFGLKTEKINEEESVLRWSTERLIAIDHAQMTFSYEIVDCNIGFKSYVSSIKVVPAGGSGRGCVVEWCFRVDPVVGWKFEDLVGRYEVGLQLMTKKMEAAVTE
ncbi:lachrymatory-factor synthase [Primulina huaijiensis]|uniref:lachrymatory-factor synthase n=1 Tax=Primulina huaijiensis TaxID=1492673 RepID=UPI003CC70799